nr:NADH dehydrogenase [ubiquinone] flavoprotein 3, mitochondrial-like isoform X1 [Nerophis lumbriciformis]
MATSLLLCRRLRTLKLENWGILKSCTGAFCTTQTGEPIKTAKKTPHGPDERRTLLAYKTEVAFPVRVSNHAVVPTQPLEAAPVPPAEPEEAFDNSTYKNNQHHNYNPFTFADLDVEMAKFRLPQPSSGRKSPQH